MKDAWFIARHDLLQALKTREMWLWSFVMPPLFFYFTGMMGGAGARMVRSTETLAVEATAADQATPVFQTLVRNLERRDWKVALSLPGLAAGSRVLSVPDGFSQQVLAGRQVPLELRRNEGGAASDLDQLRVRIATYQTLADLAVVSRNGNAPTSEALQSLSAQPRPLQVASQSASRLRVPPSGYQQSVPGTITMFTLLVLLTSGAATLVIERKEGILRRLASSPLSRGSVVCGKWLSRILVAAIQIGFGMGTGTLLFSVRWGDHLWAILLVLAVYASFAACAALLLGNWAQSPGHAVAAAVVLSNVLAAFGGCWWPIEIAPAWAQSAALATPTGWVMDALHKLMSFGLPPSAVLPHVAVLAAAALALGWLTARRMRFD